MAGDPIFDFTDEADSIHLAYSESLILNNRPAYSHLVSAMSLVGDQTNSARSFSASGLRSGDGTSSGHTAW